MTCHADDRRTPMSAVGGELRRGKNSFPRIIQEDDIRGKAIGSSVYKTPISKIQLAFIEAIEQENKETLCFLNSVCKYLASALKD